MKSAAVTVVLMASVAMAQPHGNHRRHQHHHNAKRDLVVEWETKWVTVTEIVDATGTETVYPSATPEASSTTTISVAAGQFFQTTSQSAAAAAEPTVVSTSTSTSTTAPSVIEEPTTQAAPAPSSTVEAAPVVAEPSSTSTTAAAAATSASSGGDTSSGGGEKRTGDITYYAVGMGSCGYDDAGKDNSMNIVAVSAEYFKSISPLTSYGVNQPANPLCDKTITMSASNGKTTTAIIRDSCPGCEFDSIDVSEKAFLDLFGDLGIGRTTVTWWLNE